MRNGKFRGAPPAPNSAASRSPAVIDSLLTARARLAAIAAAVAICGIRWTRRGGDYLFWLGRMSVDKGPVTAIDKADRREIAKSLAAWHDRIGLQLFTVRDRFPNTPQAELVLPVAERRRRRDGARRRRPRHVVGLLDDQQEADRRDAAHHDRQLGVQAHDQGEDERRLL